MTWPEEETEKPLPEAAEIALPDLASGALLAVSVGTILWAYLNLPYFRYLLYVPFHHQDIQCLVRSFCRPSIHRRIFFHSKR